MFENIGDTIVAVSSATGASRRGIVRLSGPRAVALTAARFRPDDRTDLHDVPGWRRVSGEFSLEVSLSVPVRVQVFRVPRSYTRQDIVELHTVGSGPLLGLIVRAYLQDGARAAEPGEFTARAFFAGAMDLTAAEGVAAAIRARSDAQLRAADRLLHGDIAAAVSELREDVVDLLALVEADIDFAEEPIELIAAADALKRIESIREKLTDLLSSSAQSERLETLPMVVLIGPPNAGKSTLLNRLTGLERAICTPLPGTTRDVLTAPMRREKGEVLLVDTAGFGMQAEPIDDLAADALERAWRQADAVILVLDASKPIDPKVWNQVRRGPQLPRLTVGNKRDLIPDDRMRAVESVLEQAGQQPVRMISATIGSGCSAVKNWISEYFFSGSSSAGQAAIVLGDHHRQNLNACLESLGRARELTGCVTTVSESAELIAFELRETLEYLKLLAGETANEEILGKIFSQFCIGK